jgi:hypothetical protein
MASNPDEKGPKSLGVIGQRVDAARADVADVAGKLARFRADPAIEEARKDLIEASNKLAVAFRKIEQASSASRSENPTQHPRRTEVSTGRHAIEDECLKVIADARQKYGDDICRPLGISPTMDPGISMFKLFQQFQNERLNGRSVDFRDTGDTLIGEFLDHLKAEVAAAAAQLAEPDTWGRSPGFAGGLKNSRAGGRFARPGKARRN